MRSLWILVWCLCLGDFLFAAKVDISSYGDRPEDGIFDPGGQISSVGERNLKREMALIKASSGIDMLVVVLMKSGQHDPQDIAESLADAWGSVGGRAVVLQVPNDKRSPWIAVSGLIRSEMPVSAFGPIIAKAQAQSRGDPTVSGALYKAVNSLGNDLRFAAGRAVRGNPSTAAGGPQLTIRETIFFVVRKLKVLMLIGLAGFCFASLCVYWVFKFWKRGRFYMKPKTFPEISWKPRFGAPYAGIVHAHSSKIKIRRNHDS